MTGLRLMRSVLLIIMRSIECLRKLLMNRSESESDHFNAP
jgi:hypothetical protein